MHPCNEKLLKNVKYFEKKEKTNPILRTRLASRMKSARLVPIRERQKTAMSTDPSGSGVCAMSQAVMCLFTAKRSNECTLFGTVRAKRASPHPKSATTKEACLRKQNKFFNHLTQEPTSYYIAFENLHLLFLNVGNQQIQRIEFPLLHLLLESRVISLESFRVLLEELLWCLPFSSVELLVDKPAKTMYFNDNKF